MTSYNVQGNIKESEEVPFWTSSRVALAFLGFLGFVNLYTVRINLSVAIVCMVNHTSVSNVNNITSFTDTECQSKEVNSSTSSSQADVHGSYDWDKKIQGTILGCFYWGYLISQVPAGWLAVRFGGKRVFGIAMFLASILTLISPILADVHYAALIVIRVLLGIVSGVAFPTMHTIWGKWAPPLERTKLLSFTYVGTKIGTIVTFPLSGFLCKYGFAGGWPSIFYITGAACLLWSILWMLFISDSPQTHSRISDSELKYITQSLESISVKDNKKVKVPWCAIFKSLPVYAIIVINVSSDWGGYTLLTNLPSYINNVLKFDIASNGLVSALPFIGFFTMITFAGWFGDFIRKKNVLSTTVTRKVFIGIGQGTPAIMLVALGYVNCSQPFLAIGILVFANFMMGFNFCAFNVNHVDIAPQFAGILFGIGNSIASLTGFLSPFVVGVITDKDPTRTGWQIVFFITACIYFLGAIIYVVFGSGELQSWATDEDQAHDKSPGDMELKVTDREKNI